MFLVHKPIVWGGIGGVIVLGWIAGCSLRQEPVPPPPVPQGYRQADPIEETAPPRKPAIIQVGTASWYGPGFHGQETASGALFDQHALTAAHRTLPLGTKAKVTNLDTGQAVHVTINDRGPYVQGRHLDLSRAAAKKIGLIKKGIAQVQIEVQRPHQADKRRAVRVASR
jgi:rare lipoprotein A (peptidoglycan hydrolase)